MAVESALTREEMAALFERRQEAFDNMDADALSRDYADDCVVDSPAAGTLRGADCRRSGAPHAGSRRFPISGTGPTRS